VHRVVPRQMKRRTPSGNSTLTLIESSVAQRLGFAHRRTTRFRNVWERRQLRRGQPASVSTDHVYRSAVTPSTPALEPSIQKRMRRGLEPRRWMGNQPVAQIVERGVELVSLFDRWLKAARGRHKVLHGVVTRPRKGQASLCWVRTAGRAASPALGPTRPRRPCCAGNPTGLWRARSRPERRG
jgi:hypothetical protein